MVIQGPHTMQRTRLYVTTACAVLLSILPAACGGETMANGNTLPSTYQMQQAQTQEQAPTGNKADAKDDSAAPEAEAPRRSGSMGFGKYLAASVAQSQSDTTAAAAYYFAALQADPTNIGLARSAYFYLLAEGQTKPALALAERVIELGGDNSIAPLVLAVGDSTKKDFARAYDRLSAVNEEGVGALIIPLMRAWSLAGQQKWDEALATLEPMGKRANLAALYHFHAALIADLANKNDLAWTHYQETLKKNEAAPLRLIQLTLNFLARQGRTEDALSVLDTYTRQNPNSLLAKEALPGLKSNKTTRELPTAQDGMAEALYGTAMSLLQNNAYDTALVFCRLSLLLNPTFSYSEMMIGDILDEQERFADAAATYGKVPTSSPLYVIVRLRLALTLERDSKFSQAEKVLADLIKAYPTYAEPLIAEGDLFRRQEKWAQAEKSYLKALPLFSKTDPRLWSLHYSLGISQERGKKWDAAEKSLKAALELNPEQPQVLNYLGYSWIDRGINIEEGKSLIEQAVTRRPTDGYIIDSLGWAYYLTGDYEHAVKELERAIEFTPADPTINDHLGDAYWRVGRTNEARFQWTRALGLKPEPDQEKALRQKLEKGL